MKTGFTDSSFGRITLVSESLWFLFANCSVDFISLHFESFNVPDYWGG